MDTVYSPKVRKWGNSTVVVLPKDVRAALGLSVNDILLMRVFGKLLIARRLDPKMVVDLSAIPADAIPSAVTG